MSLTKDLRELLIIFVCNKLLSTFNPYEIVQLENKTLPPEKYFFDLTFNSNIITIGSCFSDYIGSKLTELKFNVLLNPFGTLYHPLIMARIIDDSITGKNMPDSQFVKNDGLWRWWMGHGSLAETDIEVLKSNIHAQKAELKKKMESPHAVLFLTFGSAFLYNFIQSNINVGNCHKVPGNHFSKRMSSVSEIAGIYCELIGKLKDLNPELKIVFTVSPIRHIKDGLQKNNLSKATLLLAIDEILKKFQDYCFYFPAYELQIDGLRDYQYYSDDLVHPSQRAVEFIWTYFCSGFFSKEMVLWKERYEALRRDLSHRPLHPASESFSVFLKRVTEKISGIMHEYPDLDWTKEVQKMEELQAMVSKK